VTVGGNGVEARARAAVESPPVDAGAHAPSLLEAR
jgi:hypothetical protein